MANAIGTSVWTTLAERVDHIEEKIRGGRPGTMQTYSITLPDKGRVEEYRVTYMPVSLLTGWGNLFRRLWCALRGHDGYVAVERMPTFPEPPRRAASLTVMEDAPYFGPREYPAGPLPARSADKGHVPEVPTVPTSDGGLAERFADWRSQDKARRIGKSFLESRESAIQRRLTELLFGGPRCTPSADECCARVFQQ